ncbi:unnamed protein product [Protopolystoma xenopodis]|uniref:Uncharacterized protein n=1 Tax=Protopolystoma xenopodis TaxID=117903 RepID=A0A3S5C7E2_9PLAT|nr:unnamed protein product [Protopolystoma xenopodis]
MTSENRNFAAFKHRPPSSGGLLEANVCRIIGQIACYNTTRFFSPPQGSRNPALADLNGPCLLTSWAKLKKLSPCQRLELSTNYRSGNQITMPPTCCLQLRMTCRVNLLVLLALKSISLSRWIIMPDWRNDKN